MRSVGGGRTVKMRKPLKRNENGEKRHMREEILNDGRTSRKLEKFRIFQHVLKDLKNFGDKQSQFGYIWYISS